MKLTKLSKAVLALAFAAIIGTSAKAQITYTDGDVLIGFQSSSAANDYVVDLGSIGQFINPSLPVETFQLSLSDLSAAFTNNWATSSSVQWGVIAANPTTNLPVGSNTLYKNTYFITSNLANGGQVPAQYSSSHAGITASDVKSVGTVFQGGTKSTTSSYQASTYANSTSGGFASEIASNNFNLGVNNPATAITSGTSDNPVNPTVAGLEFYLVANTNAPSSGVLKGVQDLGSFSLNSSGVLTFTEAPEPSTYLMMGLAGLVLVWSVRRKSSPVL